MVAGAPLRFQEENNSPSINSQSYAFSLDTYPPFLYIQLTPKNEFSSFYNLYPQFHGGQDDANIARLFHIFQIQF
jgi:hypothetical protein